MSKHRGQVAELDRLAHGQADNRHAPRDSDLNPMFCTQNDAGFFWQMR